MLEYFERGVPYWYGISPVDRIRAVLKEKAMNRDISHMPDEWQAAYREGAKDFGEGFHNEAAAIHIAELTAALIAIDLLSSQGFAPALTEIGKIAGAALKGDAE